MTMMTQQGLSDVARRSKFPLAYTYLAGMEFGHPEWCAYAMGMSTLVRQNMHTPLLKDDVRLVFDRALTTLTSAQPYGDN